MEKSGRFRTPCGYVSPASPSSPCQLLGRASPQSATPNFLYRLAGMPNSEQPKKATCKTTASTNSRYLKRLILQAKLVDELLVAASPAELICVFQALLQRSTIWKDLAFGCWMLDSGLSNRNRRLLLIHFAAFATHVSTKISLNRLISE